jgi:Tfp pilus assembly PilM family ATPase
MAGLSDILNVLGASGLLGVDVGTYGAKVAKASGKKGSLSFKSLFFQPGADPVQLRKFVDEKKLTNSGAAFAIADEKVENHEFRLPKLSAKELATAVDWEIKKAVASPEYAYHDVLQFIGEEGVDVQCVVASKDIVQSRYDEAKSIGFAPKTLETESAALLAVLKLFYEGKTIEKAILFDMGYSAFRLIFVYKDRVTFTRSLYLGMGPVVQAVLADGAVKPEEINGLLQKLSIEPVPDAPPALTLLERQMQESLYTLCEEFRRSEFFVRDQKGLEEAEDIFLCGGGACVPFTLQYLQNHLAEKKIQTLNPFQWAKRTPIGFEESSGPLWACAIGLSMRDIR